MSKGSVIIVGYGPGVGAGVAGAFAAEGHPLALSARDEAKLQAAVDGYEARGWQAVGFAADAGDERSLDDAIAAAIEASGAPDALIYNVARGGPGPVLTLEPEVMMADFRLSVAGALVAARAVAPGMVTRGHGSILFTGGGLALYPSPSAPSLTLGKAGLRTLALMLAKELAPQGVRAGTVTIAGGVSSGSGTSPELIGAAFLALHRAVPDPATCEVLLRP